MFVFFKKEKKKEPELTRFHFNESVLKTMSDEIIRCEGINVYFESPNGQEVKDCISYDAIRNAMIKIAYVFTYSNIERSKLSFEGAIRLELIKLLDGCGIRCTRVSIHNISKIC